MTMTSLRLARAMIAAALLGLSGVPVVAQTADATVTSTSDGEARIQEVARQIDDLVKGLEDAAASYPETLERLRAKEIEIQKADETVADMIARLKDLTDKMDDGGKFHAAIGEFDGITMGLIAEAEGSNSDFKKSLIPGLQEKLGTLRSADAQRAQAVIEARNVIRDLEDNRSDLSFAIKANAVTAAIDMIETQVGDFAKIVQDGRMLADSLIAASTP